MAKEPNKGLFVAIEGVTGAGKTYCTNILVERLEKAALPVTRIGGFINPPKDDHAKLTQLLHELTETSRFIGLPWLCETSLLFSEQTYNIDMYVSQAYQDGKIIIYENFDDALVAYQIVRGKELKLDADCVRALLDALIQSERAVGYPAPDLTVLIESPLSTIVPRLNARNKGAPVSAYDKTFIQEVIDSYKALYTERTVMRIANGKGDDVEADVDKVVANIQRRYSRSHVST